MGKKSKRTKAKANPTSTSPPRPDKDEAALECPEDGWIIELSQAKTAAKARPSSKKSLRVAVAACQVRQWEKCLEAAKLGLSLVVVDPRDDDDDTKKKLLQHQKRGNEEIDKESSSIKHRQNSKELFEEIMKKDLAIDYIATDYDTFSNLNFLQYAAIMGDVPLMEKLIALGAAIDFPVLPDKNSTGNTAFLGAAPQGATALSLVCANLAMYGRVKKTPSSAMFVYPSSLTVLTNRHCPQNIFTAS